MKKPEFRTVVNGCRTRRTKKEKEDKALAAYYRNLFENPESFLAINENPEDDVLEDDAYMG